MNFTFNYIFIFNALMASIEYNNIFIKNIFTYTYDLKIIINKIFHSIQNTRYLCNKMFVFSHNISLINFFPSFKNFLQRLGF